MLMCVCTAEHNVTFLFSHYSGLINDEVVFHVTAILHYSVLCTVLDIQTFISNGTPLYDKQCA